MSDYLNKTEEQQFEEAKSWFKQNGTPILVAVLIAAAAGFGWNYWQKHQLETAQQTSAQYQQMMESYLQNPEKNAPLADKFISEHSNSNYAVFTQLEQAKQLVAKGEFEAARQYLTQALAATGDATLQSVIRFRLAAVAYQLNQFDEALEMLAPIKDQAWSLRKQVFSGDILLAKGDKTAARSAYEQAKAQAQPQDQMLIDIRLNNL
ncbi:tetratricopeptide repeat protein [Muribacter muris]|uniref:Ancillary SecYEG translocon subunit n=1 Tax=Muribacter muris TaxID=67855 RepID=A0A4Y9K9W4_9PAST|nr:tetratricopeptide repeat protein [Muribacter muris]MBF0783981.1 tetratricopeptide repeat protein [Muribacter muris]MBF0827470.1 tetratricopeptide repeat protein [Muribacter muris]TFV13376.1 tetratricopeptide repeat protein [Muribacter muris]